MAESAGVRRGAGEYYVELDVTGGHSCLAHIRSMLRERLVAWRYRGKHYDAVLIVSELLSNALLHGSGTPVLRLSGTPWRLRVEVFDDSPEPPALREAGVDGGWGLRLLDELSLGWGATPQGSGKIVWCELGTLLAPVRSAG